MLPFLRFRSCFRVGTQSAVRPPGWVRRPLHRRGPRRAFTSPLLARSHREHHVLQNADRIAVFPRFMIFDIATLSRVRPRSLDRVRFVADVHLGKLARRLRLLGLEKNTSRRRWAVTRGSRAASVTDSRLSIGARCWIVGKAGSGAPATRSVGESGVTSSGCAASRRTNSANSRSYYASEIVGRSSP